MNLHRLVYYSRNHIPAGSDMTAEVESILALSRRNNASAGITGALMFNAGCFAQVLEGDRDVVEATFERIQQDERHGDVSLLAFDPVASRAFGDWSMGFVGASQHGASAFGSVGAQSGFSMDKITGDNLFKVLHDLALEEEAAA